MVIRRSTGPVVGPIGTIDMQARVAAEAAAASAGGASSDDITAAEDIDAGDFVNIFASSGAKVQKANATDDTKPCNGYAPEAIATGDSGEVQGPGQLIVGLTGLTPGTEYFLDTTGGGLTATAPSSSGNRVQRLGVASSATELFFFPERIAII
jgi:hypothetical protein